MNILSSTDPRQSSYWASFMEKIGWSYEKINGNFIYIKKIPLTSYSVIKFQRPGKKVDFKKLDLLAKKHKALFINIDPHKNNFDENLFKKNGFIKSNMFLSHTSTIKIDLTKTQNQIWRSLSENARRNIRKSQSLNIKIKKIELKNQKDDFEFRKFFELLKNLTVMKKFYIPDYSEFYKKMTSFKKTSVLFFAYNDGSMRGVTASGVRESQTTLEQLTTAGSLRPRTCLPAGKAHGGAASWQDPEHLIPIAAVWLAGYSKTECLYVQTGITKEGYENLANYLIVWEILKYAKKQGYKTFDFEGIYDPRFPKERSSWKNFTEFKKRFHGEIIHYPQPYIKIYNPFFYILFQISKFIPQ